MATIYVWSKNKKKVYPCKPQFYYIKVGCKGVFVTRICFRYAKSMLVQNSNPRHIVLVIVSPWIRTIRRFCPSSTDMQGIIEDLTAISRTKSVSIRIKTNDLSFEPRKKHTQKGRSKTHTHKTLKTKDNENSQQLRSVSLNFC